jgi:hypothetical protein
VRACTGPGTRSKREPRWLATGAVPQYAPLQVLSQGRAEGGGGSRRARGTAAGAACARARSWSPAVGAGLPSGQRGRTPSCAPACTFAGEGAAVTATYAPTRAGGPPFPRPPPRRPRARAQERTQQARRTRWTGPPGTPIDPSNESASLRDAPKSASFTVPRSSTRMLAPCGMRVTGRQGRRHDVHFLPPPPTPPQQPQTNKPPDRPPRQPPPPRPLPQHVSGAQVLQSAGGGAGGWGCCREGGGRRGVAGLNNGSLP